MTASWKSLPTPEEVLAREAGTSSKAKKSADALPDTDLANAQRLVEMFGDRIRYSYKRGAWFIYDNTRWREDQAGEIEELAKVVARKVFIEAAKAKDEDQAARLARHAQRSQSRAGISAMVQLARTDPKVRIDHDQFDALPELLNTPTGTVYLGSTTVLPNDPRDLITHSTAALYDPEAKAPVWAAFLDRIFAGDAEMVAYVQRVIGYAATGHTREHKAFFLHGCGRNGKSTMIEAIKDALGDYAQATAASTFEARQQNNGGLDPAIVKLIGSRLVTASEWREYAALDEPRLKALTGGDTMSARTLNKEPIEFRPMFKVLVATNHKPIVKGTDEGIWARVGLIPFEVRIPDDEIDRTLPDKLRAERDGILLWIIEGANAYLRDGLNPPAKVLAANADYRGSQDVLAAFLDEACVIGPRFEAESTALYTAYSEWCEKNGERALSQVKLAERWKERGFEKARKAGDGRTLWVGVGLRSAAVPSRPSPMPVKVVSGGREVVIAEQPLDGEELFAA